MSEFSMTGGVFKRKTRKSLQKYLEKLSPKELVDIAVGFPVGKSASIQYPDGTSVVDVAVYNNYGTFNKDGTVHIPARPFLSIGGLKARQETKRLREQLFKRFNLGTISLQDAANIVGAKAAAIIKKTIRDFDDPPNSPGTIAKKKTNNPLVDTGLMMQSVTWDVRKKKDTKS